MLTKEEFKSSDAPVAVCGVYLREDAVHVGLVFKDENEYKVIHFQAGNDIPLEALDNNSFNTYLFNPIAFKTELIPSLAALAELVSDNILEPFVFNRNQVVYEGGKFKILTGAFQYKHMAERIVNCAVFTVGLLKTYDYDLIEWETWPTVSVSEEIKTYLNAWFVNYNVGEPEKEYYYRSAKEIRGKHIIVSPDAPTKPATYKEVAPLADEFIAKFGVTKPIPPAL